MLMYLSSPSCRMFSVSTVLTCASRSSGVVSGLPCRTVRTAVWHIIMTSPAGNAMTGDVADSRSISRDPAATKIVSSRLRLPRPAFITTATSQRASLGEAGTSAS